MVKCLTQKLVLQHLEITEKYLVKQIIIMLQNTNIYIKLILILTLGT